MPSSHPSPFVTSTMLCGMGLTAYRTKKLLRLSKKKDTSADAAERCDEGSRADSMSLIVVEDQPSPC
ncbi:uncharacterized protein ARMOST_02274 [Armillaria ostoyae]|uniref:Uncharacterized protein n=1 Tax=Armillaria ostoyae TaxID=47428 RepID=A0A284QRF3_ARMOS|nr:uncharacterized protein ARMOST_02274 [Armillaria ostoyae]